MLARWMYTDGTTYYLAQSEGQVMDKNRGALGVMMWRQAN